MPYKDPGHFIESGFLERKNHFCHTIIVFFIIIEIPHRPKSMRILFVQATNARVGSRYGNRIGFSNPLDEFDSKVGYKRLT